MPYIGNMITEDHRNITCGGDPFNYLKSVMKGLSIQLNPGQDAEIILSKDKFDYDQQTMEGLARTTKLVLVAVKRETDDIRLIVRKGN